MRFMKKILVSVLFVLIFVFSGCGGGNTTEDKKVVLILSKNSVALVEGASAQVTATVYVENVLEESPAIVWSSKNPEIATVENGLLTALSEGETTILAKYGKKVATVDVFIAKALTADEVNSFDEQYVNIYGRHYITDGQLNFDHAANAVEVGVVGSTLSVNVASTANSYMQVFVDDEKTGKTVALYAGSRKYTVAQNLSNGYHKIRLVKATEEQNAVWDILFFEADGFASIPEKSALKIEFVGDSITAGYAVLGLPGGAWTLANSSATSTYAYYTAQALNADYSVVAYSGICTKAYLWVADLNMETLYKRYSRTNAQEYAFDEDTDVVVLNLGTNDMSYILSNPTYASSFPADYESLLRYIRAQNPNAHIICLYGMMGNNSFIHEGITTAVQNINDKKIVYNPFAITADALGAAGHPSATAQKGWGDLLTAYIQSLGL